MTLNVLVTGASGRVGSAVRTHLGDRDEYSFTYLDVEDHPAVETVLADVTDYDDVAAAVDGHDAVVHLAADPSPDAPWDRVERLNVRGTYNVLETACSADVSKFVFASSNLVGAGHADFHDGDLTPDHDLSVDHATPPRPNSLYAVSKLFGEALGRYYVDYRAAPEQFYAARLGWVLEAEYDHPYGPAERGVDEGEHERGDESYAEHVAVARQLWCSRRDAAQFVDRALLDDAVTHGVFGVRSAGTRQWLDVDHAREVLGYEPLDDADAGEPPG